MHSFTQKQKWCVSWNSLVQRKLSICVSNDDCESSDVFECKNNLFWTFWIIAKLFFWNYFNYWNRISKSVSNFWFTQLQIQILLISLIFTSKEHKKPIKILKKIHPIKNSKNNKKISWNNEFITPNHTKRSYLLAIK